MKKSIETGQPHHSVCTSHLHDLPWHSANAMACVELTQECNLSCEYCQRRPTTQRHKPLRLVEREIATLEALSRSDTIVLTGGEPLLYPDLAAAVQMVASAGKKPIVLTNGVLLTRERLVELVAVGLFGVMFHVDSRQGRPGFEQCTEVMLNSLRLDLANLTAAFHLHCSFNTLVFPSTLAEVHRVALWAGACADKVHMMTFIAVRIFEAAISRENFLDDDGERSSIFLSPYCDEPEGRVLNSHDLYDQIQSVYPGYRFNSFMGSATQSGLLKWAMGTHLCRAGRHVGNLGPMAVSLLQKLGNRLAGRDISHFSPKFSRRGGLMLLLGLFDGETRRALRRHLSSALRKPLEMFRTLHLQTFIVMQSIDILPEGERTNCNGCSKKTTFMDRLKRECSEAGYVLRGSSGGDVPTGGSTQMQWPKHSTSVWQQSERMRIGREDSHLTKLKH